ncbi:MAG: CoA-acylating methylmalonate-semialdehyde dehydrogenase [Nitrososphaerota archaeon]|nr:CoA-acylating methylmalonate-semialdehyde dehydrogenase [Nitrososphaerota archaeon]
MTQAAKVASNYGRQEMLIDGVWRGSGSSQVQSTFDPGRGVPIGEVPFATREEVEAAIDSSQVAFEKWSRISIFERVKYLFKMKTVLESHFEELAATVTQNHGKTILESRGEVHRMIENVEVAISTAYTLAKGETQGQIAEGIDEQSVKEPLGVFAVITPFNFPLMVPFWFVPFAVVLGDTVVLKPSETDPIPTTQAIRFIQEESGLPPGVINLVQGSRDVVETMIANKAVRGVTFVGSTPVARRVYELAGKHGKRALANGGAKNCIVVMPDAKIDSYVPAMVSSFFGNAGQRCLAGSVLVPVGGETHGKLIGKFAKAAGEFRVGYGMDEATEMGPVVTKASKERIEGSVERGVEEGAKLVADGRGKGVHGYPDGYYLGPTILDDVTQDMRLAKEEIFGPVASVIQTDDLDGAIDLINRSTDYGNMACLFTSDGGAAREFAREANAGNIGINLGVAQPAAYFPFGGKRESFFGVLHAQIDTVDFFTDKKVVVSRW